MNEAEQAGLPSVLVARRIIGIYRDFEDDFFAGLKPDLHKMLNLPRGRGPRPRRAARREARDHLLREVAATLPAELSTWARARQTLELVHGTEHATGAVAMLRDAFSKYLPESVRQAYRILRR